MAIKYLVNNGYILKDRNFFSKYGEIDIIAFKNNEYVFIEVKTRRNLIYGRPIEAVTEIKKKHIINASKYYVNKNKLWKCLIRYDVIEVMIQNNGILINHVKNIFW